METKIFISSAIDIPKNIYHIKMIDNKIVR